MNQDERETIHDAIMTALGLCETILTLRENVTADPIEDFIQGVEAVRRVLMTAAATLERCE